LKAYRYVSADLGCPGLSISDLSECPFAAKRHFCCFRLLRFVNILEMGRAPFYTLPNVRMLEHVHLWAVSLKFTEQCWPRQWSLREWFLLRCCRWPDGL